MTTLFQRAVEGNVLGITWINQSDTLSFKVNFELVNQLTEAKHRKHGIKVTKRVLVSQVARI